MFICIYKIHSYLISKNCKLVFVGHVSGESLHRSANAVVIFSD